MRLQSTRANCGPAALRNALMARGIHRSEDELAALTGCSADGTTPRGIIQAARAVLDADVRTISEGRADIALLKLLDALRCGQPVILAVDSDQHWVAAFGLLGLGIIHVADSGDEELVQHYAAAGLCERWRGQGRRPYYGIVI